MMLNDGANSIGKNCITTEEVETFLELFDRNKDGKLSRVEIVAFLKLFSGQLGGNQER